MPIQTKSDCSTTQLVEQPTKDVPQAFGFQPATVDDKEVVIVDLTIIFFNRGSQRAHKRSDKEQVL